MEFVLSFDIPRELPNLKLTVNRELHRMNAALVHHSFWRHGNLQELIKIAVMIKQNGGKAAILEERLLF